MRARKAMTFVSAALFAGVLVSCQQVFTYSPLKAFDRNPANMTSQQQQTYAEQALKTGDPSTMKTAYDAIKGSTDPSVQVLAGELAFGASGATTALNQALADVASGASLSTLQSLLSGVDTTLAVAGAQSIVSGASGGATVTDSEYALAAAAYIVAAAKAAGGFSQLSTLSSGQPGYTDLTEAKTLVTQLQSSNSSLATMLQGFY